MGTNCAPLVADLLLFVVRETLCELNISCTSTTAESRAKIWYQ